MAGVLFIITVPRKEFETQFRGTVPENYGKNKSQSSFYTKDYVQSCNNGTESMSRDNLEEYLYMQSKDGKVYRSKSDSNINAKERVKEGNPSSPWSFKEFMRHRSSKINITRPGTDEDILTSFHWDTPLENILSEVITRLNVKNDTWNPAKNGMFWQVIFSLESGCQCEELLQVLRTIGIGCRHHSSVSVIPCTLYYNSKEELTSARLSGPKHNDQGVWSRFFSSMKARNNLAQVLHSVRAEAALTFDWLFLLIVAAFVAAIGLVENSTVILVASMLISPLMGPITAGTLGTAVRDRSLQQMGVTHELLGLFLSLVIGFIFGLAICAVDDRYGVGDWPTLEMMSRCEVRSLWIGIMVAIPSGAGVALAVLGDYTASLVGVAISASLLPPAVNAGLLWAMSLVSLIFINDETKWNDIDWSNIYSEHQPTELAILGAISLCLTLVNIVCIFLVGIAVYKIKRVCPFERRDLLWLRKHNDIQTSAPKDGKECSTTSWHFCGLCSVVEPNKDEEYAAERKNVCDNAPSHIAHTEVAKKTIGMTSKINSLNVDHLVHTLGTLKCRDNVSFFKPNITTPNNYEDRNRKSDCPSSTIGKPLHKDYIMNNTGIVLRSRAYNV